MASELRLSGDAAGRIILQGNDTIAADQTFTFPDTGGEIATRTPGNILQVVFEETEAEVDHTTASFTDTGLTANITPSSANSRILVIINQAYDSSRSSNSVNHAIGVYRDNVLIHEGARTTGGGFEYGIVYNGVDATNATMRNRAEITLVDSPSTTSQVTYKSSGAVNSTSSDAVLTTQPSGTNSNGKSYIILMEVAG